MTAWQYFAGAGLVAALCPLHGHVEVAGDGHGRGARVDLCVPADAKPGRRPAPRPSPRPSVRPALPGPLGPTARHPGNGPLPGVPAPAAGAPPEAVEPTAKAGAGPSEPAPPAAGAEPLAEAPPGEAVAAAAVATRVAPARGFHVRAYRPSAVARRGPGGMSTVMLMVVVTTPAVLAAAALRPRGKSRG
ncbi:hypothetical protein [Streptomyces sp. NPDC091268]|uniref:hypothetical protein n=1 Tax=Streptomyces sp. NPDC091268 TaxID=3365979 RepID=UPI0037FA5EFF